MLKARMLVIILSLVTALGASGCTEHSREGAVIGGAAGAGVGLLGGGGVVRGAATGAALGGAGGYIYDKVRH